MATLFRLSGNLHINLIKWGKIHSNPRRQINTTCVEGSKLRINGIPINFVEFGEGSQTLFCLPGLVGTIETDFQPIFRYFDQTKFRIVAWDPPGYGQSRPYERKHAGNFYERDAHVVMALMEELGYKKFSLLGWSNGGMTAFAAAALYPSKINKLVLLATHAYLDEKARKFMNFIRHLKNWSPQMLSPFLRSYDEKYLSTLIDDWADASIEASLGEINPCFAKYISQICCPTLAIQGKKDGVLGEDHCEYFERNINNCRVQYMTNGGHNLHLSNPREFVHIVESFILEEDEKN